MSDVHVHVKAKKLELQKERRSERVSRTRPSLALYCPPHRYQVGKGRGAATCRQEGETGAGAGGSFCRSHHYRLEVELRPQYWVTVVLQVSYWSHQPLLFNVICVTKRWGGEGGICLERCPIWVFSRYADHMIVS